MAQRAERGLSGKAQGAIKRQVEKAVTGPFEGFAGPDALVATRRHVQGILEHLREAGASPAQQRKALRRLLNSGASRVR